MNPYGKTQNWLCSRFDHRDTSPLIGARSVPSLLRLDSTGERDFRSSTSDNMASCFMKTIGGMTQRNNMYAKDNFSGVSDFPILQNSSHCDNNMAAKDNVSLIKPPTSCLGSFQGLAGCLGLNTCSPISQHPPLHQGQFQLPYLHFHPAVVDDFPHQAQSARKQLAKCQSQRTGKKCHRYFRYGWRSPPKKSNVLPEGQNASAQTKPEDNAVCKKRKHDKAENVHQAGEMKQESEMKNEEKIKCTDIKNRGGLSSQMSNLSLGESVAIRNALGESSKSASVSTDTEKSKPDWFSIGRGDSETKLSPTKLTVCDNWDDEMQPDNWKLQDDILDLLAIDDAKSNSEPNAHPKCLSQSSENNGPQIVIVGNDCDNPCVSQSVMNNDETRKNDTNNGSTTCQNNEPHAVLYQRNINKKCRPSNKKRSRRKGSKHSKSFRCEQGQKRKSEDVGSSSQCGASAIAFILGNSVSPSMDIDSDFSFDSDEDSSESTDDDIDFVSHFAEPLCLNVVNSHFVKPLCMKVILPAKSNSFQKVSPAVRAANRAWQISLQQSSPKTSRESDKKVHFATPENLTETHDADDWIRKGPWEEFARDRARFQRRIKDLKGVLDPVLADSHRQHVYATLYCP